MFIQKCSILTQKDADVLIQIQHIHTPIKLIYARVLYLLKIQFEHWKCLVHYTYPSQNVSIITLSFLTLTICKKQYLFIYKDIKTTQINRKAWSST